MRETPRVSPYPASHDHRRHFDRKARRGTVSDRVVSHFASGWVGWLEVGGRREVPWATGPRPPSFPSGPRVPSVWSLNSRHRSHPVLTPEGRGPDAEEDDRAGLYLDSCLRSATRGSLDLGAHHSVRPAGPSDVVQTVLPENGGACLVSGPVAPRTKCRKGEREGSATTVVPDLLKTTKPFLGSLPLAHRPREPVRRLLRSTQAGRGGVSSYTRAPTPA